MFKTSLGFIIICCLIPFKGYSHGKSHSEDLCTLDKTYEKFSLREAFTKVLDNSKDSNGNPYYKVINRHDPTDPKRDFSAIEFNTDAPHPIQIEFSNSSRKTMEFASEQTNLRGNYHGMSALRWSVAELINSHRKLSIAYALGYKLGELDNKALEIKNGQVEELNPMTILTFPPDITKSFAQSPPPMYSVKVEHPQTIAYVILTRQHIRLITKPAENGISYEFYADAPYFVRSKWLLPNMENFFLRHLPRPFLEVLKVPCYNVEPSVH